MECQNGESEISKALNSKWNGPISVLQISEGIKLCIQNSRELFNDAVILLNADRAPRAMSLLIAAIEELGKASVVASMARIPQNNSGMWRDAWADFRTHQYKSTWAITHSFPDECRADPASFLELLDLQFNDSGRIERVRQVGLYVDFLGTDLEWFAPLNINAEHIHDWGTIFNAAFERVDTLERIGLYSFECLQIQHEVYSPCNANRKRRKQMTNEDWQRLLELINGAHLVFWRRLIENEMISSETDLSLFGVPINEFVGTFPKNAS